MERMTRVRAGVLVFLFALLLGYYCFRLYHVQVFETGGNQDNITKFETRTRVKAARGNIMDRNGNVLVTNRASYDLVINHYVLTSSDNPNATLYRLGKLCRERGLEYTDHLPITLDAPFEKTLDLCSTTWQNHFKAFLAYRDYMDPDIPADTIDRKSVV